MSSDSFSFFKAPETKVPKTTKPAAKAETGCDGCPHTKNQQLARYWGRGDARILLVVETHIISDTRNCKPFTGDAGAVFMDMVQAIGAKPSDFWVAFSSPCGPDQSHRCRTNLDKIITELDPVAIVPMGIGPVQSVITSRVTGRMRSTEPSAFYSERIPDQHYGRWICPTWSPYEIARHEHSKNSKGTMRTPWRAVDLRNLAIRDLAGAMEAAKGGKPEIVDYTKMVEILPYRAEAIQWLSELQEQYSGPFTFDFETTGLKPQRAGHFIDTVSWCVDMPDGSAQAVAAPFHKEESFQDEWNFVMRNGNIEKIAHNAAFEAMWNKWRGSGAFPQGWYWDTCIAAHVLHNQKPTGLKFQTYVNFGVMGYDDAMDDYLVPSKDEQARHGANAINRIADAPKHEKLLYCGLDSLFSHLLQRKQEKEIRKPHNRKAFALFMEGFQTFTRMMDAGIRFDESLANQQLAKMQAEISELEGKIASLPGIAGRAGMNLDSDPQVVKLLYDVLGYPVTRFGRKADKHALEALKAHAPATELCELLLRRNKLGTAKGYIQNYIRESVDGVLRGFIGLTGVSTFRSSSDSPNMQNVSKRDKEMKTMLRACFKPSPGNCLDECDLRGAEVFTSACVHTDPKFLEYVRDWQTKDMHRDLAMQLYVREPSEYDADKKLAKDERQNVKGPFTFACLYGMSGQDIADNMWHGFLPVTLNHIRGKGLYEKEAWTRHVCAIYDDFWNNRFKVYGEWKRKTWQDFRERGYIDGPTGFRIHAPASYNQVTNAPIQGPAFHVNLFLMGYVASRLEKATNGRSRLVLQIHDSQIYDIHPEDRPLRDKLIREALEALRKKWPWLVVPIVVEMEGTKPDEPWNKMEEIGMIVSDWEETVP